METSSFHAGSSREQFAIDVEPKGRNWSTEFHYEIQGLWVSGVDG